MNSIVPFLDFGFIFADKITYHDIFRDKLLQITLSPDFVLIMSSRLTISIVFLKIDSDSMRMVVIEH